MNIHPALAHLAMNDLIQERTEKAMATSRTRRQLAERDTRLERRPRFTWLLAPWSLRDAGADPAKPVGRRRRVPAA